MKIKRIITFFIAMILTTNTVFALDNQNQSVNGEYEYVYTTEGLTKNFWDIRQKLKISRNKLNLTEDEREYIEKIKENPITFQPLDTDIKSNGIPISMSTVLVEGLADTIGVDITIKSVDEEEQKKPVDKNTVKERLRIDTFENHYTVPFDTAQLCVVSNIENFNSLDDIITKSTKVKDLVTTDNIKLIDHSVNKVIPTVSREELREGLLNGEITAGICAIDDLDEVLKESNLVYTNFSKDETYDYQFPSNVIEVNDDNKMFLSIFKKYYDNVDKMTLYRYNTNISNATMAKAFNASLTREEKEFIAKEHTVKVGVGEVLTDGSLESEDKANGYVIDNLKVFSLVSGLTIDYRDADEKSFLEQSNDLDILVPGITGECEVKVKELEKIGKTAYVSIPFSKRKMVILKQYETNDIGDITDLKFFDVGTTIDFKDEADYFISRAVGFPKSEIKVYKDLEELGTALKEGEVTYAIEKPGSYDYYYRNSPEIIRAYSKQQDTESELYSWSFFITPGEHAKVIDSITNKAIMSINKEEIAVNWFNDSSDYETLLANKKYNSKAQIILRILAFVTLIVFLYNNVKYRRRNRELISIASVDDITNLPNLLALANDSQKKFNNKEYYFILLDIKNFRVINSVYGIITCDSILREIGVKLTNFDYPAQHKVYRHNKDIFAIVMEKGDYDIGQVLTDINDYMRAQYRVDNFNVNLLFNIGAVFCDRDDDFVDTEIKAFDMLKLSKTKAMKKYVLYNEESRKEIDDIRLVENSLLEITKENIEPYFQPFVNARTGDIKGCEMLARLKLNGEIIPAYKFIPIAKQNGTLGQIDTMLLMHVITLRAKLLADGVIDEKFYFSVNISDQFLNKLKYEDVDAVKSQFELEDLAFLQLEVLEEELTELQLKKIYKIIKDQNIRSAVDDFSTGFSSITRLNKFNFKTVKIDKSLLPIDFKEKDKVMYQALVNVIEDKDREIVAEGVETKEHYEFLEGLNVTAYQGYYFSKPVQQKEFIQYLKENYIVEK